MNSDISLYYAHAHNIITETILNEQTEFIQIVINKIHIQKHNWQEMWWEI